MAEMRPLRSNEALEARIRPLEAMMAEMRPMRSNEALEAEIRL